jgi:hypothetical protein
MCGFLLSNAMAVAAVKKIYWLSYLQTYLNVVDRRNHKHINGSTSRSKQAGLEI